MNPETLNSLVAFLAKYHPLWIAFILAVSILCYKSPEIIQALR